MTESSAPPSGWQGRLRALLRDINALQIAYQDPRTPWIAKVVALMVLAYAASPIDLIPDFIPILGHLDDLVLLPLGILLARRLIPPDVMADARLAADQAHRRGGMAAWVAAAVIVGIWLALLLWGWTAWRAV